MSASDLIARMVAAGTPVDIIGDVAMALARAEAAENILEGRRAKDRARKAVPRNSEEAAESAEFQPDPSPQSPPLKNPPDPQKITPPLTPQPDGRTARATAFRLPDDWKPSKLGRDTVSGQIIENRGQEWARRALESFRNHWRSANGPNARKRDWQAAWANWVIEQDNRDGRSQRQPLGRNQSSPDGLGATARAAMRAFPSVGSA